MARLKLTVFAALALGLGLAQLFLSATPDAASAVTSAQASAVQAGTAVDGWIASRRAQIGDLALAVAQSPEVVALVAQSKPKPEAPTPATFQSLREKIAALTPAALKGSVLVGWSNPAGALFARNGQDPAPQLTGVDPALAGPAEATVAVDGVPYRVIAIAVPGKVASNVIVGAPLLTPAAAEDAAKALGLDAVAVLSNGQVVAAGGAQKASVGAALKGVAANGHAVVKSGTVAALGPVALPLGGAPLEVVVRHGLSQSGLEVAAVASTREALATVAQDQQRALMLFGGGLVAFLVCLVWMGGAEKKEDDDAWQPIDPAKPAIGAPARPAVVTPSVQAAPPAPAAKKDEIELSGPHVAPEANPDDFDFSSALQQLPEPAGAPVEAAAEAADPGAFGGGESDFDADRTTMYPTSLNGTTQLPALSEQAAQEAEEEEHDATRVAAIPSELLQASVRRAEEMVIPAPEPEPLPTVAPSLVDSDEVHFQEVFQEFLTVREQCGEAGENLTYDKFAAKLRKNREALTQKYSCRTVRFQVYVKEGKAALKATPVKD